MWVKTLHPLLIVIILLDGILTIVDIIAAR
jgi:hypothetical protein